MKHLTMNVKHFNRLKRMGAVATALGLSLAASTAFAEGKAYEMVVYSDSPTGKQLLAGELEEAMDVGASLHVSSFERYNNQCVSLTLAGDHAEAAVACDAAVTAARRSKGAQRVRFTSRGVMGDVRTKRAMAFTNRGVLRAVQGDLEGAREDFETAVNLTSRVEAAPANLATLGEVMSVAKAD